MRRKNVDTKFLTISEKHETQLWKRRRTFLTINYKKYQQVRTAQPHKNISWWPNCDNGDQVNQHKLKRLGQAAKSRLRTRLKESWFLLFIILHSTITNITSPKAKKRRRKEHEWLKCSKTMSICPILSQFFIERFTISCLKKKKTLFSYWTVREMAADRSFNSSSFHLDSGAAAPAINTFSRNTDETNEPYEFGRMNLKE